MSNFLNITKAPRSMCGALLRENHCCKYIICSICFISYHQLFPFKKLSNSWAPDMNETVKVQMKT